MVNVFFAVFLVLFGGPGFAEEIQKQTVPNLPIAPASPIVPGFFDDSNFPRFP